MDASTLNDGVRPERAFLTGTQVLVRLPLEQARRDRAAGLDTGGFISGYRGSPLGGYDKALWRASAQLEAAGIVFRPAINEEMATTAIIGSQQVGLFPGSRRDGVFAIWYGKGPGLDRAGDAFKHANSLGSAPLGGVLAVVGDDHGAMSSSMAHQSEQLMMAWMMPVLVPAGLQDYLDFGLLGLAMSRFSGCWSGLITVSEVVESGAVVETAAGPEIIRPVFDAPPGGLHIRLRDPQLAQESRLWEHKLRAVRAFARANRIDRVVWDSPAPRLGIAAAGKAWLDLRQALDDLGIDAGRAAELGLRLYKVGMSWPLEPDGALAFARGLRTVLVVEEKRGVIEPALKELFYHLPADQRPQVLGKTDPAGRPLLPSTGELSPELIARVLAERLGLGADPAVRARLERAEVARRAAEGAPPAPRPPFFCSGCPHNCSTRVPEGSRALAGTGCHVMAAWMPRETASVLHMGAEGANWVGLQPFSDIGHVFQNLGDGTYVHSGSTAIRQAVAAGITITYKILYNDAVAMTGGQPLDGQPDIARITHQIRHEGVGRIAVVSDDPGRHRRSGLADGVTLHPRAELDRVQRELRRLSGVSVLIYDQGCAAEKRRRRRHELAATTRRVVINEEVCDGCGDCLTASNCVSLLPVAGPDGVKRRVDQSACNQDFSCADGFCPSFVTVEGRRAARPPIMPPPVQLPPPAAARERGRSILVAGIGGTGVVTITQIIGHAAFADGLAATTLDFNGLAQKGGGVLGYIRLAATAETLHAPRIGLGGADSLLACDMVVATGWAALSRLDSERTRAVINLDVAPTAASVLDPDALPDEAGLHRALTSRLGPGAARFVAAGQTARRLSGDAIFTNVVLLGHAWQSGLIPLSEAAMVHAIRLNGIDVDDNLAAFAWGRWLAHDPEAAAAGLGLDAPAAEPELAELVEANAARLTDYHDAALAQRYRALVARVEGRDRALAGNGLRLSRNVAVAYARLLAVKDEFEVARQLTDPGFLARLAEGFEGPVRPTFMLGFGDGGAGDADQGGRPRKRAFGPWLLAPLRLLARIRRWRGSVLDPFRFNADRELARGLIVEYEADIDLICAASGPDGYDALVELAALPRRIRGYGPIRRRSVDAARKRRIELHRQLRGGNERSLAAE
jgi:indolepyruvate ferredoxin oxidoreductase